MKRYWVVLVCCVLLFPMTVLAQGDEPDADGDGIPDYYDACPNEAGVQENYGCPAGVTPPDTDADGVIDLYDRCPAEAGPAGLDCPDRDGDQFSDRDDQCPDEAGTAEVFGCVPVKQISLPANLAALTVENVGQAAELGRLVMGVSQLVLGSNGTLIIQKYGYAGAGMDVYDLNQTPLAQSAMLESQGGIIGMSADGKVLVDTFYNATSYVPTITVWDVTAGNGLHYIEVPDDHSIMHVVLNADGSQFATADGTDLYGPPLEQYNVRLWDTASGSQITVWSMKTPVAQLAFTPDGSRLLIGTDEGVTVYDVAALADVGRLDVVPMYSDSTTMAFSPDGSKLAVGQAGGSVSVWDVATASKLYEVDLLTATEWDAIRSVAWSVDGSLIAAGGGPLVDGPMPPEANNRVAVLNAADGTELAAMDYLSSAPHSIVFSSSLLIFVEGPKVHFWGIGQ